MMELAGEGRPLILCEYAHDMGNSVGGYGKYWNAFRKIERMQGGFVWDWADQGLLKEGNFAYGGDFGDKPNDRQFSLNRLVFPERTAKPALTKAKYWQQYFQFDLLKDTLGKPLAVKVTSEYCHRQVAVELHFQFTTGEEVGFEQVLPLGLAAGQSTEIQLPDVAIKVNGMLLLNLQVIAPEAKAWHEAGFELAHEQFVIHQPLRFAEMTTNSSKDAFVIADSSDQISCQIAEQPFVFSKVIGGT